MTGFIDAPGSFFIGRGYDPATDTVVEDDFIYYDSRDLTTHGLVLGMTGSGKTGLCVDLLEEAILDGVPAIVVDPKGDIGNILLTFPDLQPADFEPWVDRGDAERKQMDLPTYAASVAANWAKGLADWGITRERMEKLRTCADYTIYTPGSESGVPISILASLRAPKVYDEEATRDQINGTVTAILSLAGISTQSVTGVEHVFVSNIVETNWRAGKDLTLEDLILQVQEPPFEKLGVLPVEQYYPAARRMELVMALNNVIAAPSFKAWLRGVPMDIQSMLYTPEGKPRVAVLYIAHLNDTERMFIMTLVLESLVAWMRNQGGTTSLRALLYIDEIFGFFPPIQNPPSKEPLMRLLKQARAFGLGVLVATQNPVDLDYKGLSNIGTWFIGRLQSEGDRDRIISGLKEAAASGDMDLAEVKQLVAQIKSRVFLMRNVHQKGKTTLFTTRWAMSYLAGPMTRQQIEVLMAEKRAALPKPAPAAAPAPSAAPVTAAPTTLPETPAAGPTYPQGYSATKPAASAEEFFLPVAQSARDAIRAWETRTGRRVENPDAAQLTYDAVLLAQVSVRFDDRASGVRTDHLLAYHVPTPPTSGFIAWDDFAAPPVEPRHLETTTRHTAGFGEVPVAIADARRMKDLRDDLVEYLFKHHTLKVKYHPTLNIYGGPDDDPSRFEAALRQAAREHRDKEVDQVTAAFEKRMDRLEETLEKKEAELKKDKAKASGGSQDLLATGVQGALSLLQGRKPTSLISRVTRQVGRRGELKAEVEETEEEIKAIQQEIQALAAEFEQAVQAVQAKWDAEIENITEKEITPLKKNIQVDVFGLGWVPYYAFQAEGRIEFEPAFEQAGT